MGRGQQIGCFGFVGAVFAVAFLWVAILYVGIPLAIVGGIVAAYLFNAAKDDAVDDHSRRNVALMVAGGSAALFLVSLAGNIFTDDGPFGRPTGATGNDSEEPYPLEIRMRSACLGAVLGPTDDEYGIGLVANGSPVEETIDENADGTATVRVIRERANVAGLCPVRLVATCTMNGDKVLSHTDLREDGHFPC